MDCNAQIIEKELCFLKKHLPFTVMSHKCNIHAIYDDFINFTKSLNLNDNNHTFMYSFDNILFSANTHIFEGALYMVESSIKFKSNNVIILFNFDINYDHTNYLKEVLLKSIKYEYIDDDNKTTFNIDILEHNIVFISFIESLIENDEKHVKKSMDSLCEFLQHAGYCMITGIMRLNYLNGFVANGSNFVKFLNPIVF
jgi:hypothetical protein